MRIVSLRVEDIRNLAPQILQPGPRFNVFHGDNGQGKTNLVETVYVVAALRSFRTTRVAELLRTGAERAVIAARVERGGLERVYELVLEPHARKVRIDGKAIRPFARYFGGFNVVLFAPEDLQIPKGAPTDRRRFLDRAVFNRDATFMELAQDHEKVLRSRNALLRAIGEGKRTLAAAAPLLDVYDEQLARGGAAIVRARRALLAELTPRYRAAFEAITRTGIDVELRYLTGPELTEAADDQLEPVMASLLAASRGRDLARGATLIGPHRDDLDLRFAGHPAAQFASQGQLRAMILAWKTAELDMLAASQQDDPILLLDDVTSELDPARNEYLFEFLAARTSQCFITTTHPKHVLLQANRIDYTVQAGRITAINGA